jgi:ABC-2 type transport system ATP-binding protein
MSMLHLKIEQQQYNNKTVLEQIDQSYPLGAIHGVLGENGAGKTTLFHCMANLIPFKGEQMIPESYSFGYLPAELYMFPLITGDEFLKFYVTAKKSAFDKEKKNQLNQFFDLPLNRYASTYSTGMLKKLYLLGILLQQNDILLLDEPFNDLDFKSSAFITALIISLKEQGHTLFVASHDIEHLFSYSDTISLIKDKGIAFYPTKEGFKQVESLIKEDAMMKVGELKNALG